MDNYIIRVYRCEKDNPRMFVGTVEEVGLKDKRAFTNYDELWEILNPAMKNGDVKKSGTGGTIGRPALSDTYHGGKEDGGRSIKFEP